MKHIGKLLAITIAVLSVLPSCDKVDDTRIPSAPVNIVFNDNAMWTQYGVTGATLYQYFIKSERKPATFPYLASTYTGYGGVLLICDYFGNPVAYDMSCPVECKPDVRIQMQDRGIYAECPVCHSTYNVYESYGTPVSGPAKEREYGLTRYRVMQINGGMGYQIVN